MDIHTSSHTQALEASTNQSPEQQVTQPRGSRYSAILGLLPEWHYLWTLSATSILKKNSRSDSQSTWSDPVQPVHKEPRRASKENHPYVYVHMYVCMSLYIHIYVHICICICFCVCISAFCMYMYMYTCMYTVSAGLSSMAPPPTTRKSPSKAPLAQTGGGLKKLP